MILTIISGIPMVTIPHPQGPWLEGENPVTNLEWSNGVNPLMQEGAKYCLVEPHDRGDFTVKQFGSLNNVLDVLGRDNVPADWDGGKGGVLTREISGRGALAVFQWLPKMSRPGFDRDQQPVVDVSWYHSKGWVLSQGGLYLLTDPQWEWSGQGGERELEYATRNGKLTDRNGKKLAHCSVGTGEDATIDVNDSRYPDGPFGLRHKTGNVWEWVERNPNKKWPYGLRGGSWNVGNPGRLRVAFRGSYLPDIRGFSVGFRVGAVAPQDSR